MNKPAALIDLGAAEQASRTAAEAAERSHVRVAELATPGELAAAADLLGEVWGSPHYDPPVSPGVLRALSHTGNYVAGAYTGTDLVGVSVGFLAYGAPTHTLHSHITGLAHNSQRHGIGYALKLHQRAWAIDRGLPTITWTFDPLVRRNAYFNLTKLRAEGTGFHANFYGEMADQLNVGDETDRCEVSWDLLGPTARRVASSSAEPDIASLRAGGAAVLLDRGGDDEPRVHSVAGDLRLCWIPEDIVAIRATSPEQARAWRVALRDTFGASITAGFRATAMSRSGWYVLELG